MRADLTVAIVGAGRTRQGLGPFLAQHAEAAGCRVVAVSGRDGARAAQVAGELGATLGHEVASYGDPAAMLAAVRPEACIVAAPPAAHAQALAAALQHRVPTLCEKPLLPYGGAAHAVALVEQFAAAGILLIENCQWPYVLPDYERLFPGARPVTRSVELRLSPTGSGRAMVEDSLSHFLSLVQAVLQAPAEPARVRFRGAGDAATEIELRCEFVPPDRPALQGRLELVRGPESPRPAWFALDGRRADRSIQMPEYRMQLTGGGRTIPMADPLQLLVYRFADLVRRRNDDELRSEARAIQARARAYDAILDAWPGG